MPNLQPLYDFSDCRKNIALLKFKSQKKQFEISRIQEKCVKIIT